MKIDTYTCLDCTQEFDEPERFVERHGFRDDRYEVWYGCPFCGGPYVRTLLCDKCNEQITDEFVHIDGVGDYCEGCFETCQLGDV